MSKSKILTAILILLLVVLFWIITKNKRENSILSPITAPVSTPDAPKQFKFDSSTDLKKELDNINPQVLDSDFELL